MGRAAVLAGQVDQEPGQPLRAGGDRTAAQQRGGIAPALGDDAPVPFFRPRRLPSSARTTNSSRLSSNTARRYGASQGGGRSVRPSSLTRITRQMTPTAPG